MNRAARTLTAALALTVLAGAPSAAADGLDPATAKAAYDDMPFHYATGDHLGTGEYPTTNRYGYGRSVFLVGDSMAGHLADGLLRVTEADGRALLPRTRSGSPFRLPGGSTTPEGRWADRVRAQVRDEAAAGRRPIVVLAGQKLGSTRQIRGTVWRLRNDGATVYLATAAPLPTDASSIPSCVVASSSPNTSCRYTIEDAGVGRWATLTAARQASPAIPVLDMRPLVARGKGPTYAPVHTGVDGPVQVYRGAGSHVTATWSREVLRPSLASFIR